MMAWLACDMDDGILGAFTRRRDVIALATDAPIAHRYDHGPGDYEYIFGYPDDAEMTTIYVVTPDAAVRNGFGWAVDEWRKAGSPVTGWFDVAYGSGEPVGRYG